MAEQPDRIEYRPRIKEMPAGERPRERLLKYGPSALSNAELIAIVLRSGLAGQNVLELGKRLSLTAPEDNPQIRSPEDVANLVMADMALLEQEHLRTLLLDAKNRVQSMHTVYVGKLDGVNIRVADVFREAVRRNAAAMIVVHSHRAQRSTMLYHL